ncbi:cell growth regulator with EF hand domain protein 1 [Oryzias latipes]|uniref:Cell growth regulator with EF-hand domain 1 n=1 Tax=Oryzias latipes TaxID=8090 RepID=H2M5X7_ORYLA|nr:cell growth regulator with EF hand domain protein 1 [Oryzias latipes]XP_004067305.1 cell growth regulator with EF hand domain protein 1 [Oryzias latipes]
MDFHPVRLLQWVLSVFLLLSPGSSAPGQIVEPVESQLPPGTLLNPFGSREEEHRLLQSYIQPILKNHQGGPEITSWEQEVFFLFRLYDFDRSGFLDGLEMMKLLSDYSKHHSGQADASELIVSTVDFLLQTQDLNHDGLLDPSELLSPLTHTQGSQINQIPQTKQEVVVENRQSAIITEEQNAGAVDNKQQEDPREDFHPQEEEIQNQETQADKDIQQIDKYNQQQIEDAPVEEQEGVPVHQGQPEI